jgi:methylase of polypeptide subunit release factors
LDGQEVLVKGVYSNGLLLLRELRKHLSKTFPEQTFEGQRKFRQEYQKLSNRILLQIENNGLVVKKSPDIGWLKILYPDSSDFVLSFPQVQGLNSSWQWYKKGVSIPVLRNKIHPYYGVYFPSRYEHLLLFDNWLKRYQGPKKTAIDVGVGSGVLSFQMTKYGFQKVFATDTNPNAIIGLKEFMGTTKLSRKIELDYAHLFGKWNKPTELIVFNPPWLPEERQLDGIDQAVYYHKKLFPEFFEEAKKRLLPDGKIVLLFSNLGQVSKTENEHPIRKEIEEGTRFKVDLFLDKSVKKASEKTTRNQFWRETEKVELWVLTHK